MNFVNPYFLFALLLIAIPIIIHLFNFRRYRKVFFTNVKFLKELKQETQKQSKLKHLLVLSSRILAIIFLVLAFAQPYIPIGDHIKKAKINLISVYIDNSFSMQSSGIKGNLLEEAKEKAIEIAAAYKTTDQFQLLTNDFEGKHQRFVTKEEFVEAVKEIVVSPVSRKINEVIARQNELFSNFKSEKTSYIVSDFQKSFSNFKEIKIDTGITTYLLPLASAKATNILIDSCWFESPSFQLNQQLTIVVRIKNNSEISLEKVPVKLMINNQQRSVASIDVAPFSQTNVSIPFMVKEKGIMQGSVEIIDFPVTFDDKFFFSFSVSENIRVLSINEQAESPFIQSLFKNDSAFVLANSSIKNLDYSSFEKFELIVLNELNSISSGFSNEITKYISKGGSVIVFPATQLDIGSYRDFLTAINAPYYLSIDTSNTFVSSINLNSLIYKNVFERMPENIDLPKVYTHYIIQESSYSDAEYLLKMQNGQNFLISKTFGKGKLYLSSVPLNVSFSNFAKHALFVPTLYNVALYSASAPELFYFIGQDDMIDVGNKGLAQDDVYKIINKKTHFEVIPEQRSIDLKNFLFVHNQIKEAGNYDLTASGNVIRGISFNYNRTESDMKFLKSDEIEKQLETNKLKNYSVLDIKSKPLSDMISELTQGIHLWKLFVLLALLFLAVEVFLLKFLK